MPDAVAIGRAALFTDPNRAPNVPTNQAALTFKLNFDAEQLYEVNTEIQQGQQAIGLIKGVFIENAGNPNNVTITSKRTQQSVVVPAYANAFLPITSVIGDTIQFYSLGGNVTPNWQASVKLFNYDIQPFVWYTTAPLAPGIVVNVLKPVLTNIVDRDYTLIAATAHNVFPAVADPRNITFWNYTNEVVFYQINADATGVAADNYQAQPGEKVDLDFRTALRISMYSVNGGFVQAYEWDGQ